MGIYFTIRRYEKINGVVKEIGSYTQPRNELLNAIEGEVEGVDNIDDLKMISIEPVEMSKEKYESLPEFTGY